MPPAAVTLQVADYLVIGLYMLFLVGLGVYYRRFSQASLENYFLGGRRLSGWMSGTSYAATCMNADVAPAYCGMTVISGLFVCWWYLSRFGVALMIGGILFAASWYRLKIFTSPEFYELRYSGGAAVTMRTWVSLRSAFIAVVAWTGAGLLGLTKVTEALLGWSRWETLIVVIPVILLYVILSGYMGVVISDIIQSIIMIVSSLIIMGLVWSDFGGPAGLHQSLVDQFGPAVTRWYPPSHHEFLGVVGIAAWAVGSAVGYGGDTAPMAGAMEGQRLLSCRSASEASKMYFWTAGMLFFMLAVLTLPALGAMAKWPGLHDGTINKELAYGLLLGHYLPPGLLGLSLVAMFASIMSTVDSNMNFGAQVFVNDVYKRWLHPQAGFRVSMWIGRLAMVAIMGLALVVALFAQNVIDIAVFMLGLASAELTANWAQWWWWRFNGKARLAASFGGPLIFLINKWVVFEYFVDAGGSETYLVVLCSIGATLFLWVAVAFLTKPDPDEKLVEFYRRAQPMGWWGPISRKAGDKSTGPAPIFIGLGLALIASVALSAAVIAFSCVYVGQWLQAVLSTAVAVICGVWFRGAYGKRP